MIGCAGGCSDCDTPLSDEVSSVSTAVLPDLWADNGSVTILLVEVADLRVSDRAVDALVLTLQEQAGLEVVGVSRIRSDDDVGLTVEDIESLGFGAASRNPSDGPLAVIVKVPLTTDLQAHGWISSRGNVAVICLEHDFMSRYILPEEDVETLTMIHEFGHWLGVPAREHHTAQDGHCTDCRCVMQEGGLDAKVILANLFTGLPRFGEECVAELMELRRRRGV